jgi:hypothetical protein
VSDDACFRPVPGVGRVSTGVAALIGRRRDHGAGFGGISGRCERRRRVVRWVLDHGWARSTGRRGDARCLPLRFGLTGRRIPRREGAQNVPDLLTSIREELAARLEASREAVEESELLEAALRVLDPAAGDGRASSSPSRARTGRRRGRATSTRRIQSAAPDAAAPAAAVDAGTAKATGDRVRRRRVRRS